MALFGKKDSTDAERHEEAAPGGGELRELTTQLDRLGEQLRQANNRVVEYLVRREAQARRQPSRQAECRKSRSPPWLKSSTPCKTGWNGSRRGSNRWPNRPRRPARSAAPLSALAQSLESLIRQTGSLAEGLRKVQTQLDGGFQEIARLLRPPEPVAEPQPAPRVSGDWERAIVGPGLAANANLTFQRQQLVTGVLDGDAGACALAGQLLVFQSAPAERLPQLLKDIGEAYYRWQPKTRATTNPMEEALVAWLRQCCDLAGISNTIELVHPGERFDAARHNAASRGVEITAVHGWIVLRDNGKVYMKATVDVR